ncbi:NB-ARC domain-containing protein [Saccharopolyspora indica]|uniref:NB-ARC domain-containing protein n=1 Tax=Saccharopolyspora indica TaxID=1229659 RepID=UPI0022EA5E15|nr:NB-ARC domain-containing protein [Saccharopolyspora indica]MDA3647534.1 NB-ARC domain-containing protein [Saccharopolyspora indica]
MSAQPPVSRSLPVPPTVFVDRADELRGVLARARSGGPLLTLITGPQGIGKTTFALKTCAELADLYPGPHLFHEVNGSEPDSVETAESVAGSLLAQLGLSGAEIPARAGDRFAKLRSALVERKALVFLDDVARADQVEPLLFNSASAAVLVTSRRSLPSLGQYGFTRVKLTGFGADHAKELIERLAGDELGELSPEVLSAIHEVCDGLPLALSIAGFRLGDGEPAHDYVADLRRAKPHEVLERDGERPVLKIFELDYQEFNEAQKLAYARLSLLPGADFGIGVAAAVLDLAEAEAGRLLRELARRHVIQLNGDRFRFHSLIREHAKDKARTTLSPVEIASTVETARTWYWRRQVALDQVISGRPKPLGAEACYDAVEPAYSGLDAGRRAWAEIELEWPNLIAAMRAGAAGPQDELSRVFPLALWFFGYQTHRCNELIDAYCGALQHEVSAGEKWQLHRDLAGLHERCGDHAEADEQVELSIRTGYEPGIESSYTWRGLAHESRGDRRAALADLERALEAVPLMDVEQRARATALLRMHFGRNRCALGEFERAASDLAEARGYFAEHGEQPNLARVELDLGRALLGLQRRGAAVEGLTSAYEEFRARGMADKAAEAAAALADAQDSPEGAEHWRRIAQEL